MHDLAVVRQQIVKILSGDVMTSVPVRVIRLPPLPPPVAFLSTTGKYLAWRTPSLREYKPAANFLF